MVDFEVRIAGQVTPDKDTYQAYVSLHGVSRLTRRAV